MAYNDHIAVVTSNVGAHYVNQTNGTAISVAEQREEVGIFLDPLASKLAASSFDVTVLSEMVNRNRILLQEPITVMVNPATNSEIPIMGFGKTAINEYDNKMSPLRAAFAFVGGSIIPQTFENISKYFNITYISKKRKSTFGLKSFNPPVINVKGARVYQHQDFRLEEQLFYTPKATVYEESYKISFNEAVSFVANGVSSGAFNFGKQNIEPVTATIEDYKPPSWGNTGSGSGVRSIRHVIQKFAFAEINMSFDDCYVTEALGLPTGMIFEKAYIKGAPTMSGTFPIILKLSNGRVLEGLIIVPNVPRQL